MTGSSSSSVVPVFPEDFHVIYEENQVSCTPFSSTPLDLITNSADIFKIGAIVESLINLC